MPLIRIVKWSGSLAARRRDLWTGAMGVGLGLLCTEAVSRWVLGTAHPWFLIPMGASAVLVFAVPASPLAQPWPLMGGNIVSAVFGVLCHLWLGDSGVAVALAAGSAVAAMFALRCVHPPGGAMAVTAVLGGPPIHELGMHFVWLPVTLNTVVLAVLAVCFHRLSGHEYPHHAAPARRLHDTSDPPPSKRGGIEAQDLDAALASYGEILDVDRGDLEEILTRAQLHAQRRHWAGLRCSDIMSRDLVTVAPETAVADAWRLLAHHRVKSLPVVTRDQHLVGIVSVPDFFIDRRNPGLATVPRMNDANRVEEIMTREVRAASPDKPLVDLAQWFSDVGLHHVPVTDSSGRLVGMVTQSDLVGALLAHPVAPVRAKG